jgi:hypothetical protein
MREESSTIMNATAQAVEREFGTQEGCASNLQEVEQKSPAPNPICEHLYPGTQK